MNEAFESDENDHHKLRQLHYCKYSSRTHSESLAQVKDALSKMKEDGRKMNSEEIYELETQEITEKMRNERDRCPRG